MAEGSFKRERERLASDLRRRGKSWVEVAREFRTRYRLNARAAFRLARGWSQADAADEWNRRWPDEPKTFKSFSCWELWPAPTGHAPSLAVLTKLAELYECHVADLLVDCPDFRHLDNASTSPPAEASRPDSHDADIESPAWTPPNGGVADPPHGDGMIPSRAVRRAWTEAEVVAGAAEESARHAGLTRLRSVDPAMVEELQSEVVRIARHYPYTPPLTTLLRAIEIKGSACQMVERTRRPDQEGVLYLVIGQSCGLLASATFDLGHKGMAATQAQAARLYAQHIGHRSLSAWACGMQGLIAYWSGRPYEACDLIREAREGLSPGTALVRLCSIEARAWSHLGNRHETPRAILDADAARERATGEDELHDEIGGEFSFDFARQARCNGSAWLELGDGEAALEETQHALGISRALPQGQRWPKIEFEAYADLAAAHLLLKELEGAGEALRPVFALPCEHRIEGLTQRLARVRGLLTTRGFKRSHKARELAEQIADFTAAATAGRALPVGCLD